MTKPANESGSATHSRYAKVLAGIMAARVPMSGDDLKGMIEDFAHSLADSPFLAKIRVRRTGDPLALVEASGVFRSGGDACAAVARELERMWMEDLRYHTTEEAHAVSITGETVELSAVTVSVSDACYISARVIVTGEHHA